MGHLRSGFIDYEDTYEYTPDFIEDVDLLIYKTYKKWSLYEDYEEFKSSCWIKVVSSLDWYDKEGGREYGRLSPFIHQVIWNEATRLHSKHKKMSCEDISNPNHKGLDKPLFVRGYDVSDLSLRDKILGFANKAYDMGVYLNQEFLYKNYTLGHLTPAVKAFMWDSIFSHRELSLAG